MPIPFRGAGIGLPSASLPGPEADSLPAGASRALRHRKRERPHPRPSSRPSAHAASSCRKPSSSTCLRPSPLASGSAFKDFFVGQTITARASMEANLGIDLSDLSADDLRVEGSTISVRIPHATVFNIRPLGPLDVKNRRAASSTPPRRGRWLQQALAGLNRAAKMPPSGRKLERADIASASSRLLALTAPGMATEISFR